MSSSLTKAMKSQKTHRERRQPEARKSLGLLEKKKDYRIRAKHYNSNKAKIKNLHKKVLDKNPDEFYFNMINSELRDGVHHEKRNDDSEEFTLEQIALMQTQDIKYVIHKRTIEKKKIDKLKANLHLTKSLEKNSHTFFVDSENHKKRFDVSKRLRTHPDCLERRYNRPTLDSLKTKQFENEKSEAVNKTYSELVQRIQREQQLGVVQEKMQAKKRLQNKNDKPSKIVTKGTKTSAPVYLWNQERKK